MQYKRIILTLVVVGGVVLLIGILMAIGPSLMNAVIALHSR